MKNYIHIIIMIATCLMMTSCTRQARLMAKYAKKGNVQEKDSAAMYYVEHRNYDKASFLLEELMGLTRTTPRYEEILRKYAMCKYNMHEYLMATYFFDQYLAQYPTSKYAEEFAYLQAYSFYLQSDPYFLDQVYSQKAAESLQAYILNYPNSKHIKEAEGYLSELYGRKVMKAFEQAKLYYKVYNYKAAVSSLQSFMDAYPDSKYKEEANFLLVKSAYELSLESIEVKKVNRFKDAIEFYQKFMEKYPNSIYKKEAVALYDLMKKGLEKAETEKKQ